VAIWTIRNGSRAARAWIAPLAIAAALSLSSWIAVETGENQGERVEQVLQDAPLDAHEEAAEAFLTGSFVLLLVTAAGFVRGPIGKISRVAAGTGAIALIAGATYVGHTGGQLVYKYGAASAYTTPGAPSNVAATGAAASKSHDEED
jgi:hypothetical protein